MTPHDKKKPPVDEASNAAAAELWRRAQAGALLRLYRESEGHSATSIEEFAAWAHRLPKGFRNEPTMADIDAAERERPDLAALARRSNPFLSGEN